MSEHRYSKAAWGIASRYSAVLASETRDLAAAIDLALETERSACIAAAGTGSVYLGTEEGRVSAPTRPDREVVARIVAEQLGENYDRMVDEHFNPGFCKEDFRRCADALSQQFPGSCTDTNDVSPPVSWPDDPPATGPEYAAGMWSRRNYSAMIQDFRAGAATPSPSTATSAPVANYCLHCDETVTTSPHCDRCGDPTVESATPSPSDTAPVYRCGMPGCMCAPGTSCDPEPLPSDARTADAWQDISTAPKDGTQIIVWPYWSNDMVAQVYWRDMRRSPGRWEITPSFFCNGAEPTHWMPLPAPPISRNERGGAKS